MKWLITGGCGFIGSAFTRRLMKEGGHQVRIVDNLSVGQPDALGSLDYKVHKQIPATISDWGGTIEIFVCDILDADEALKIAQGADAIVHLAANTGVQPSVLDPTMDCVTNVIGTQNYLEAARHGGAKRFIFASSGAPVGEVTPPIHEEIVPHPVSPYGASKLCGEAYCSAYFHSYGVETVALRFGNVYGPGSGHKTSVVARFCNAILSGDAITIYGDGTQTRDFIALEDLLAAVYAGATVDKAGGEVFQIATAKETTVNEIAEMVVEIAESRGFAKPDVNQEGRLPGDVMRNFSDTSKALRVLGWEPKTQLRAGLEETFDWFVAFNGDK